MAKYTITVRPRLDVIGQYDSHIDAEDDPNEEASFIAACTLLHGCANRSRYGFDAFVGNVLRRVNDMRAAETEGTDGGTERELPGGQEQPSPVQRPEHDDGELDGDV